MQYTLADVLSHLVLLRGTQRDHELQRGPPSLLQQVSSTPRLLLHDQNSTIYLIPANHVQNEGVSSVQYLVAVQAGTEPFTGSATLVSSAYSARIQVGGSVPPLSSTISSASTTTSLSTSTAAASSSTAGGCVGNSQWAQCGGIGWTGSTCCEHSRTFSLRVETHLCCLEGPTGYACTFGNQWWGLPGRAYLCNTH